MNLNELRKRLMEEGIPEYWYNINSRGLDDDRYCIEWVSGKWLVYYSERGEQEDKRENINEEDACEDLYIRTKNSYIFDLNQRARMQEERENRK